MDFSGDVTNDGNCSHAGILDITDSCVHSSAFDHPCTCLLARDLQLEVSIVVIHSVRRLLTIGESPCRMVHWLLATPAPDTTRYFESVKGEDVGVFERPGSGDLPEATRPAPVLQADIILGGRCEVRDVLRNRSAQYSGPEKAPNKCKIRKHGEHLDD